MVISDEQLLAAWVRAKMQERSHLGTDSEYDWAVMVCALEELAKRRRGVSLDETAHGVAKRVM